VLGPSFIAVEKENQAMKRVTILIVALIGAAALATIFTRPSHHEQQSAATESTENALRGPTTTSKKLEASVGSEPAPVIKKTLSVNSVDAADYQRSRDYLEFARSTLARAKAGDPGAQFYLGKALGFCETAYHMYFRRNGKALSLDEGLQYSADVHRPSSLTRSVYERCHGLEGIAWKEEFGAPSEWVERAASAGQPAAQSMLALDALQRTARDMAGTGGTSEDSPQTHGYSQTDAVASLAKAVQSKDPEALWYVGSAQGILNQNFDDKMQNELAWWLVSCQRGFTCDADADWILMSCPTSTCQQGLPGSDFIRVAAGDNWQKVQARAQQISDMLDANDWSKLGFGS
jgi:hypothetical protein